MIPPLTSLHGVQHGAMPSLCLGATLHFVCTDTPSSFVDLSKDVRCHLTVNFPRTEVPQRRLKANLPKAVLDGYSQTYVRWRG